MMDGARQDSKIMTRIKMPKSKAKKTKKQKASGEKAIIIVSGKKRKGQPGSTRMLNPQPLPPKQKAARKKKKSTR
jgi:hypothetical protein